MGNEVDNSSKFVPKPLSRKLHYIALLMASLLCIVFERKERAYIQYSNTHCTKNVQCEPNHMEDFPTGKIQAVCLDRIFSSKSS